MRPRSVLLLASLAVLVAPVAGANGHFSIVVPSITEPVVPLGEPGLVTAGIRFQCSALHANAADPIPITIGFDGVPAGLRLTATPAVVEVPPDTCLANPASHSVQVRVEVAPDLYAYREVSYTITATVPMAGGESESVSDGADVLPGFYNVFEAQAVNDTAMLDGTGPATVSLHLRNLGNGPARVTFTVADVDPSLKVAPIADILLGAIADAPNNEETIRIAVSDGVGAPTAGVPTTFTVVASSSDGSRPSANAQEARATFVIERPVVTDDASSPLPAPSPVWFAATLTLGAWLWRRR